MRDWYTIRARFTSRAGCGCTVIEGERLARNGKTGATKCGACFDRLRERMAREEQQRQNERLKVE